jgi:hypothetical protein
MRDDPSIQEPRRSGRTPKPRQPITMPAQTAATKKRSMQLEGLLERLSSSSSPNDQIRASVEESMNVVAHYMQPFMEALTNKLCTVMEALEQHRQASAEEAAIMRMQLDAASKRIESLSAEVKQQSEELQANQRQTITELLNTPSTIAQSPNQNSYARLAGLSPPQSANAIAATTLTLADKSYCTIDTTRVREEDKELTHPGIIRESIERAIRKRDKMDNWRCVAVTKDMRNGDRVRITCRSEEEMKMVREVAGNVLGETNYTPSRSITQTRWLF